MERTQPKTILLAEEMQKRFPSMEWKRCLQLAREYHDPAKKVSRNIVGMYGLTHSQFIANLVSAHIRHNLTPYDSLLHNGYAKEEARKIVQPAISRTLLEWSK
jgi:hypothetical protein